MAVKSRAEAPPESDRFAPAPHPRDTHVLFGHETAEAEFLDAWRAGRLPHAWILGGPQGIGKATLAWRMARFLAAHPDPSTPLAQQAKDLGLDPAHPVARKISALSFGDLALLRREWNEKTKKHFTRIGVDEVRRAIHIFEQAAGEGGWRMVIVDSADDLNPNSANALLKMIEEPPPRSLFLIVAHQPGRILPTITSRCRRLILKGLPPGRPRPPRAPRSTRRAKRPTRTPFPALAPGRMVLRGRLCGCCPSPTPPSMAWSIEGWRNCRESTGKSRTGSPMPLLAAMAKPSSTPS